MKKQILSSPAYFTFVLLFLLLGKISISQVTRISIANGSWNNPAIWSPTGVPTLADDSIIINTNVTYAQNIYDGQAMFRVNSGASLIDLGNDTAAFGGDRLVVNGYFSVGVLAIAMVDSATVNGILNVSLDIAQSGDFIVQSNGQVCVGQQLTTSDLFINRGSVRTSNWTNAAVVSGNGGKFCIANYFINTDAISGNIDICDATPNTPFDVNVGTIAGTITYCTVGPCGLCPAPSGIASEFLNGNPIKIFPNPFSSSTQIEINPALLNSNLELIFLMYDATGKEVRNESVLNSTLLIDRENLSNGIYFYRMSLGGNPIASGKIVVE